jgi:hypothetical protein
MINAMDCAASDHRFRINALIFPPYQSGNDQYAPAIRVASKESRRNQIVQSPIDDDYKAGRPPIWTAAKAESGSRQRSRGQNLAWTQRPCNGDSDAKGARPRHVTPASASATCFLAEQSGWS